MTDGLHIVHTDEIAEFAGKHCTDMAGRQCPAAARSRHTALPRLATAIGRSSIDGTVGRVRWSSSTQGVHPPSRDRGRQEATALGLPVAHTTASHYLFEARGSVTRSGPSRRTHSFHQPARGVSAAHAEGQRHGHPGPPPREGMAASLVGGGPASLGGGDAGGGGADRRSGAYGSAITRWESLTRPAPAPTDAAGRLRADFVEWMQALDAGWVTAAPGLGRPAQLTALGNGVVPQQAARALQLLAPPFPRCPRCADR
ncbi:hypothetical protein SUDANB145_02211 [Streptomyces sp. enrichment culture]